jgi:hypothetical protein
MSINTKGDGSGAMKPNMNTGRDGYGVMKLNVDIVVIVYLIFILICSFVLVVREKCTYLPMFGFEYKIPLMCPFRSITGHDCPFCGMTRCFVSLSHFDFVGAARFNTAGILAYVLCVLEIIYRAVKILSENRQGIIGLMGQMREILFMLMLAVAMVDWVITF